MRGNAAEQRMGRGARRGIRLVGRLLSSKKSKPKPTPKPRSEPSDIPSSGFDDYKAQLRSTRPKTTRHRSKRNKGNRMRKDGSMY